jgi:hypothetical protein
MITTDAGAPADRRRHAYRHLAAIAIGGGLFIGGLAVSGAATAAPIRDWVPPVKPRPAPELTTAQVAELLPVSMVHERNAMLGTAVPAGGLDSATRSYIAEARAAQAASTDGRYVYVFPNAKDQAGSGPSPVRTVEAADLPGFGTSPVRTDDAKDHPGFGTSSVWTGDAKDHPGFGPSAPATRAVWVS